MIQPADAILEAQDLDELNLAFRAAMRGHGFDCYAVGRTIRPGAPGEFFLLTWPALWLERYAANGFVGTDPVVDEAQRSPEAFTWTELRRKRPGEGDHIYAAAAEFGWTEGLAVPVHGPGPERGLVSLAALRLDLTPAARQTVVGLSLLTYRRARELATRSRAIRPALTDRQRDALVHVARGCEDAEIAAAMSVSLTTARNHVHRARERLGASTRAQAVAIAIVSRLI